jgi:UDP-N-acetylmuramoylalanine--D-glutamate ligase
MAAAAASFTGVEHRLELVAERAGVRWYNDSIATAPERAAAALRSFTEPVVLLAGGRDKKAALAGLRPAGPPAGAGADPLRRGRAA